MPSESFKRMCIVNVLDGLREGLSHFSQTSRAAILFALKPDDPIYIYDPHGLLRGHEPRLKELFVMTDRWRQTARIPADDRLLEPVSTDENQLTGLISYGGRSSSIFFQLWFTEHHPDICSTGPVTCWLDYAARILSRNIASEKMIDLGTSDYVLMKYATHAVRDYIVDRRNVIIGWDTQLRIFPILDAVLSISKTLEEGSWPRGELVFVEPKELDKLDYLARFPQPERPDIQNHKHARKLLLAVENSARKLVSDGSRIFGLARGPMPRASLSADFRGGHGFLKLDEELICSFADGSYRASSRRANLVHLEEALLESNLDPTSQHKMFQIITRIVHSAGRRKHGCTIVIDMAHPVLETSGQNLETPLDLTVQNALELAESLAKVDGALLIGPDLKLYAFACLLDGHTAAGENRARGARFNSALRFTTEHPDVLVVVVSADRPVSVIKGGVELNAQCLWRPVSGWLDRPLKLTDWIEA